MAYTPQVPGGIPTGATNGGALYNNSNAIGVDQNFTRSAITVGLNTFSTWTMGVNGNLSFTPTTGILPGTGNIRLPWNGGDATWLMAAGGAPSQNIPVLWASGSAIQLGHDFVSDLTARASTVMRLAVSNAFALTITGTTSISTPLPLLFGTNPSTTGWVRMPAAASTDLVTAKYTNGTDAKLISMDSSAVFRYGDVAFLSNFQGYGVTVSAIGDVLYLYGKNTKGATFTDTEVQFALPIEGDATAGNGLRLMGETINITGPAPSLTNAQKARSALTFTGTGNVTITLPDAAYTQYVITNLTSGILSFTDGGVGADVYATVQPGATETVIHINGQYVVQASDGWIRAVDINFAQQTTQSLPTDGNYTIGGKTWTKFNSANDNVAMSVTNGQGLVIQPKSTSDYNGATRTFPGIELPLAGITNIGLVTASKVRVTVYIAAQNFAANYDGAIFGIDSQSAVCGYIAKYGYVQSGIGTTAFIQAASTNQGFKDSAVALGATSNVLRMIVPNFGFPTIAVGYAAGTSNTIPAPQNFKAGRSMDNISLNPDMSGLTIANMAVILGAQRAGSGTAVSCTISRVVVEYQP
jgi:hypothetical protein